MMWKLKYNVAPEQQIDAGKLARRIAPLVILAVIFVGAGWNILAHKSDEKQDKLNELSQVRQRLEVMERDDAETSRLITGLKKKWKREVAFANRLIDSKVFSIVSKLDILETIMPAGLSIQSLKIKNSGRSELGLKIQARSFPKLVELYRHLQQYNLNIKNESEAAGLYQANLTVEIPDEMD
jgi:hypothetical protein